MSKNGTAGTGKSPSSKRSRPSSESERHTTDPRALESSLKLSIGQASEAELQATTLQTNRAPLVLAFAVMLLKYTMPEQPMSSRLSLAQAVVSANSKSKAQSIGIDRSTSAEDEGWGQGQPKVKVLGREIPVMRRTGYEGPTDDEHEGSSVTASKKQKIEARSRDLGDPSLDISKAEALWGLDLEALRKSNGPLIPSVDISGKSPSSSAAGLPIYSPSSARSYLLRSFTVLSPDTNTSPTNLKKKTPLQVVEEKEAALSLLLQALDLLIDSWSSTLNRDELDRRAWSWYVNVRPEVAQGDKGWGQKGGVDLKRILGLRKV